MLPDGTNPADVLVVMEPTRNAWVPVAAWFRRQGAEVVMVPPERSADLRRYYSKHAKTDQLDSRLLARLPMLHPLLQPRRDDALRKRVRQRTQRGSCSHGVHMGPLERLTLPDGTFPGHHATARTWCLFEPACPKDRSPSNRPS
jgi:transposase